MSSDPGRSSLLRTKLYRPPVTDDFVLRPRLDSHLDRALNQSLTLVSAAAGYGKTTMVSSWLPRQPYPWAWISLDKNDSNLRAFTAYFVAATREHFPDFGRGSEDLLNGLAIPSVQTSIRILADELDQLDEEFVLVLDDYSTISDRNIHELLNGLLQHPPRSLHLVIVTRIDPSFPLDDMRARNHIVEIRSRELRFTLEETQSFLERSTDATLSPKALSSLWEKTEGWPAGLRLAALLFDESDNPERQVAALTGSSSHILNFLASTAYSNLPDHVQSFLSQSSILDQMCGPLCQAIVAGPEPEWNGQTILKELVANNLFTISLDDQQEWYRYHHLFRDFLQHQLARETSQEAIFGLYCRAADWFARQEEVDDALRYYVMGRDFAAAARLVADRRHVLLNQERWGDLLRWLELLPRSLIEQSPDLLLTKAWFTFVLQQDLNELELLLNRVKSLLDQTDLEVVARQALQAEVDGLRSFIYYAAGDGQRSHAHAKRALEGIPRSHYTERCFVWTQYAGAQLMISDEATTYAVLQQATKEDLTTDGVPHIRMYGIRGFIQWVTGDLSSLLRTAHHILAFESAHKAYQTLGWAYYFQACVCYERNELVLARQSAQRVFDLRYRNPAIVNLHCGLILALIDQAEGPPNMAQQQLAQVTAFVNDVRSPQLALIVEAFQAELDILQGHTWEAVRWVAYRSPILQPGGMAFFYVAQLTTPKVLLAQGTADGRRQAEEWLSGLHEIAVSSHNVRVLIEVLALQALLHDAQGDLSTALAVLNESLSLAQAGGFIRLYVDLGPKMAKLLGHLQHEETHADYIAQILAAFPPAKQVSNPTGYNEPWPVLLTTRELDVLRLLAERLSDKEIAARLTISPVTVKRHALNIYQKLGVNNRRAAVAKAKELRIF